MGGTRVSDFDQTKGVLVCSQSVVREVFDFLFHVSINLWELLCATLHLITPHTHQTHSPDLIRHENASRPIKEATPHYKQF